VLLSTVVKLDRVINRSSGGYEAHASSSSIIGQGAESAGETGSFWI